MRVPTASTLAATERHPLRAAVRCVASLVSRLCDNSGVRVRLLVLLTGVIVLCAGVATFLALWGSGPGIRTGVLTVNVSDLRASSARAVTVALPDKKHTKARVFLVRQRPHGVHAFLGVSTHLGCRLLLPGDPRYGVGFTRTSQQYLFEDPCGGSVYAINGDCTGGPCPRGLDRYVVQLRDDTAEIDLHRLIKGPRRYS
jgi:Rieske Fe-S protein